MCIRDRSYFLNAKLGFPLEVPGFGSIPPSAGGINSVLALNPATVRTTTIHESDVLVDSRDYLDSESLGVFFDLIFDVSDNLSFTNKVFFDWLDREKRASYGFSQRNDGWSLEEKIVVTKNYELLKGWDAKTGKTVYFGTAVNPFGVRKRFKMTENQMWKRGIQQVLAAAQPKYDYYMKIGGAWKKQKYRKPPREVTEQSLSLIHISEPTRPY